MIARVPTVEDYKQFKKLVEAYLEDFEDYQAEFEEFKNINKLKEKLIHLELDSEEVGNLADDLSKEVNNIQKSINNILYTLTLMTEV